MSKEEIAEVLVNIGTLLELKGENPFKSRAYLNAARALESLSEPLDKLIAEDRLGEVKGIGEALQKKITELVATGKLGYYEDLKAATPPGLVLMLDIPGLGPKKIKAMHDELGIETVEQLERACKEGKVAKLEGIRRENPGQHLRGHRAPPRVCRETSAEPRVAGGRAAARGFAVPPRRCPLQHGRQPAAESRGGRGR